MRRDRSRRRPYGAVVGPDEDGVPAWLRRVGSLHEGHAKGGTANATIHGIVGVPDVADWPLFAAIGATAVVKPTRLTWSRLAGSVP